MISPKGDRETKAQKSKMTYPRSHICKDLNPGSPAWMVLQGCWEDVRTWDQDLEPSVSALDPTTGPSPPLLGALAPPGGRRSHCGPTSVAAPPPSRPHLGQVPLKARGPAAGEPTRTGGSPASQEVKSQPCCLTVALLPWAEISLRQETPLSDSFMRPFC